MPDRNIYVVREQGSESLSVYSHRKKAWEAYKELKEIDYKEYSRQLFVKKHIFFLRWDPMQNDKVEWLITAHPLQ